MHTVYVVSCPDYGQVEEKIGELLAMMGGMQQFAAAGERIVLKPNLLTAAPPEHATTTHPAVVAAVGKLVKQTGAAVALIDSPGSGFPHSEKTLRKVYAASGMNDAAAQAGIDLSFDITSQPVSFPQGVLIKRFDILTPLAQASGIINLCKLKTHGFLGMTGAVKNSFGAIPGRGKPGFHAKLQDTARFAGMCLDLSACVAPRLTIMDAVVGMEGNGPHNGSPRKIGLLLASTNPLALDVVATEIIGMKREQNPLLMEAAKRGWTPTRLEEIELIGIEKKALRVPDFRLPATVLGSAGSVALRLFAPIFKHAFSVRPQIIADKCVGCGVCRDACPVQVITIEQRVAHIRHHDCIRCYCCHEMCPHDAIALQGGALYRLLHR